MLAGPNLSTQLLYFVSGVAFFSMALALLVGSDRDSSLRLARRLPLLAAFDLAHALVEWTHLFVPDWENFALPGTVTLRVAHTVLTACSFALLAGFGATLVADEDKTHRWLRLFAPGAGALWVIIFLVSMPAATADSLSRHNWLALGEAASRYMLALPGALLTAWALKRQLPQVQSLGGPAVTRDLNRVALLFIAYAFFAGVVVPPVPLWPGRWVNTALVATLVSLPAVNFRVACDLVITWFTLRSLRIFRLEHQQRVVEAERRYLLAAERERVGRDLHDGVIQSIFGCGLVLDNTAHRLGGQDPETARTLTGVVERLNRTIAEIRSYILVLTPPTGAESLTDRLQQLTAGFAELDRPQVRLELAGEPPRLSPDRMAHIEALLRELVTNSVRHSQADTVIIRLDARGPALRLHVIDDGVGLAAGARRDDQRGLRNLRERAQLLGAVLAIESSSGRGTVVTIELPEEGTPHDQGADRR